MSKQPFLYEEKLPLSVHYQDLQASSMGHLFYAHGNQTPEFKKYNTLEKDMHTSKHYSSRWRAFEISQEHTVLRSKGREEQHLARRPVANITILWWRQQSYPQKKKHCAPKKCRTWTQIPSTRQISEVKKQITKKTSNQTKKTSMPNNLKPPPNPGVQVKSQNPNTRCTHMQVSLA